MQTLYTLIFHNRNRAQVYFYLMLLTATSLCAHVDLEEKIPEYVLETKRIVIDEYPDAFNPSVIKWNGNYLMSFRTRNPSSGLASRIGMITLDKKFNPLGSPSLLKIEGDHVQDPRFFSLGGHLYIAYSDLFFTAEGSLRRMCLAKLSFDGVRFTAENPEFLLDFDGEDRKFEKNWVPFIYNDCLLLSYTLFPHKVFFPLFGENKCITTSNSDVHQKYWKWGEIRGGSPSLLVGDHYLGFFHSSIEMSSVQSEGKKMPHYFMGAYIFSDQPPFIMTSISPEPIIGTNFYNGKLYKTWKPLRVVFPGGFVFDDQHIWVFYGRQDHEVWVVKLDREGLLKSLMPLR